MLVAWQIGELIKQRYRELDLASYRPEQNLDLDDSVRLKHNLKKSFEVVFMAQKTTGGYVLTPCSEIVRMRELKWSLEHQLQRQQDCVNTNRAEKMQG